MNQPPLVFKLKPAANGTHRLLWGLTVFVFVDAAFVTYLAIHLSKITLWPVALLVFILAGLVAYIADSSRRTYVELSREGVRIRGDIFGRLISLSQLIKEEARALNLKVETDFKPKWKTIGTNLPGYHSGWFRLRNGKKALVFVTDFSDAILVPTRNDFCILMSLERNQDFLEALVAEI